MHVKFKSKNSITQFLRILVSYLFQPQNQFLLPVRSLGFVTLPLLHLRAQQVLRQVQSPE